MAALENVYHNFPRLAKQSGFNFQLQRGRVNWFEIENLDINEITEGKNFELLERNLVNITNFNVETELDFKVLDRNFVKLFKLAQLGVDYLSYCEIYLDRCVVLLQEQLIASQGECELLKKEIQKRKEANKSKNKNKTLNYQCEKCAKVFISDVYLKFHEKRRHSSTTTPGSFDGSPRACSCNSQKNEDSRKLSISTQTACLEEAKTETQEDTNIIKMQHLLKVEKLELELQELKERFKKAENALSEKAEASKSDAFHSINVPQTMQYNSMLMLLPSYLTNHGTGYWEINSGCSTSVPEVRQPNNTLNEAENSGAVNNKHSTENTSEFKNESTILAEKNCEVLVEEKAGSGIPEGVENFQMRQSEVAESFECEKENVDPKIKADPIKNLAKPLPPPRKLKKGTRESPCQPVAKIDAYTGKKTEATIVRSTPVKEKLEEETNTEILEESIANISEIQKPKANSVESLQSQKPILFRSESKSFIKKIIKRDSPSIQNLSKNFRKSLNNLCDSVSSTEKEATKKETNVQNLRAAVVDGLNNHLQQLGISSEWSGIPKKTMREKLSTWRHQRRLLFKGNPLYPVIRQNIEEKIFQKLKKNFKRKKANVTNKLNKQESENSTVPDIQNILPESKTEVVKSRNCFIYDTDTDSESTVSDPASDNRNEENNSENLVVVEDITSSNELVDAEKDKESDILLFRAGGSDLRNVIGDVNKNPVSVNQRNELFLESDTDSSFLDNFCRESFKKDPVNELIIDKVTDKTQFELSHNGKPTAESGSILKDGEGFQSKPITNTQKKVLFAMYSKDTEEELSDDPTDDDLWSLKSGWEKNGG